MITRALINGVEAMSVPVGDRGLQYGDGVFRTLLVDEGAPLDVDMHLRRLQRDAARIGMAPLDNRLLLEEARAICRGEKRAVLKILLTRGESGRGYKAAPKPAMRMLLLYPPPEVPSHYWREGVRARICAMRLSRNPVLAGIKHLNRLEQVLARAEWSDTAIAEGLVLDTDDHPVSGISSNLFFVSDGVLMTPDLSQCGVEGVTRQMLLDAAPAYTRAVQVREFRIDDLLAADECFVCNAVIRIWPVTLLEERRWPVGPVTRALQEKFAAPWLRAG